ncbi:MAG: RnfABCDGE type electron transport complex subunit D [Proteobacteria bacterium]|nr:RnfABCDGE type electron transport complex subunit D [Pseudomonadota bacterium]
MDKKITISSSPHVHSGETIAGTMHSVILALIPATLVGIYYFGLSALWVTLLSVFTCLVVEAGAQKALKKKITIYDGSAALTGLLLAMNLPPAAPWWIVVLGGFIAIAMGKHIYGGLGFNPFNPALVARVVLLISFPLHMTTWSKPQSIFNSIGGADAITEATPLGLLKEGIMMNGNIDTISDVSSYAMFMGNSGGSLGEVSAIALLLGAIYLIYKGYITWHIPVSFIVTAAIFSGIFWFIDPTRYADPLFHILAGGMILGAFFMATDYVTSPVTGKGMIIFGAGCGLITMIIRLWGGYPEGVSFAILLMNSATPLIDRYTVPKRFGSSTKQGVAG